MRTTNDWVAEMRPFFVLMKVGDTVETKFGEKLQVLEIKKIPVKKQGEFTEKVDTMILAKSGDTNCWFSISKLKEEKNG